MKIAIVDYGMGNIKSIVSTLQYLSVDDVFLTDDFSKLKSADKIILPGVGAFSEAMNKIKQKNIHVFLKELVLVDKKPLLGICLGMQLLGKSSTEDGFNEGLGFVNAFCEKFDSEKMKVPHVGFNQVAVNTDLRLYKNFKTVADFYFTHSYKMQSEENINQCHCDYDGKFIASFEQDNVAGTQFHPELSQKNGLNLLTNFINNF